MSGLEREANIIYLTLFVAAILAICLIWYILSIRRYHLKNIELLEEKLKTELFSKEEERKRISQDLHDELGANISAAKLYIQGLLSNKNGQSLVLERVDLILEESLRSIHQITNDLYPTQIERNGLWSTILDLVGKINHSEVLNIQLIAETENFDSYISKHDKIHLYRVVKEIIQNTIKHSRSDTLIINFKIIKEDFIIQTEDQGIGFEVNLNDKTKIGNGLNNIINRIEAINGAIYYESKPGKGLKYIIKLPRKHES